MESFDVMTEPWLLVRLLDGTTKRISLYDTIVNAHQIKYLVNEWTVNISEAIMYGFLCDFVQSVYKPTAVPFTEENQKKAIVELYEKGSFDEETLDSYIEEYKANGFTFDLFDDERPFLQCSKKEFSTLKEKEFDEQSLASRLFGFEWGGGSRSTFWLKPNRITFEEYASKIGYDWKTGLPCVEICDTPLENEIQPTISEYILCLLNGISYTLCSGVGSANTVLTARTGSEPVLVLNKGATLFETITASIGIAKKYDVKPFWEKKTLKGEGVTKKLKTEFSNEVKRAGLSKNHLELLTTPVIRYRHSGSTNTLLHEKRSTPDADALSEACSVLSNLHPRVIKTTVLVGSGNKKVEVDGPMDYRPEDNLYSKDNPSIKTQRLTLGKEASNCKILNINLEALKEEGYGKHIKTVFYFIAINSSAHKNITERQEIFEWNANKEFPTKTEAKNRLDRILQIIGKCAKFTAMYITIVDEASTGERKKSKKDGRTLFLKDGESKVERFSQESVNETLRAVKDAIFEIEEIHYEELCQKAKSIAEGERILEGLTGIVIEKFIKTYDSHRPSRNSILTKMEVKDYFIKKLKEEVKK